MVKTVKKKTAAEKSQTKSGKQKAEPVRKSALKEKGAKKNHDNHVKHSPSDNTVVPSTMKSSALEILKVLQGKKATASSIEEKVKVLADAAKKGKKVVLDEKAAKQIAQNARVEKVLPKLKAPATAPAVRTPPSKVHRTKSPPTPLQSETESAGSKGRARAAALDEAAKKASTEAEFDASNLSSFLDDLQKECARRGEEFNPASLAELLKSKALTPQAGAEDDEEEKPEESGSENEEEDDDQESVEGEEEEDAEDDPEQEVEEKDEDNEEAEGSDMEEEEEKRESDKTRKGNAPKSNGLAKAVAETKNGAQKEVRNSSTHKKEWDRFSTQCRSKAFPLQLAPMLKRKKTDLFGIWLDSEEDWDACVIEVERSQESSSLSRKQWTAIQVKDLRKTMPEAKLNELVTRRKEAGLYYNDEDWPDDGEEKCARAFVRGGTWGTWGSRAETGQSHTKTRWC